MTSDLIENPCPVCRQPSRSCGHTTADLRAYHAKCRALRRAALAASPPARPVRHHPVPARGPAVFPDRGDATGLVVVPVDGRLLKMRSTAPKHPVRDLTDAEYCGQPTPPKPAA